MSKEQDIVEALLKPRFKVIALWPFELKSSIGSIHTEPSVSRGGQWTQLWRWWDEMGRHPHLFKPMPWWEERKESEMPGYVKGKTVVYKVDEADVSSGHIFSTSHNTYINLSVVLPTTEAEYLEQNQKPQ